MKKEFGSSYGDCSFEVFSHAGLFYLKDGKTQKTIAKANDIKVLRSYIDGFEHGHSVGNKKYFNKYMDLIQKLRSKGIEVEN